MLRFRLWGGAAVAAIVLSLWAGAAWGATITSNSLYYGNSAANDVKVTPANAEAPDTIRSDLTGGGHTFSVGHNTSIGGSHTILNQDSGNNTFLFEDWSEFTTSWAFASNNNIFNFIEEFQMENGTAISFTGAATGNVVNINLNGLGPAMAGEFNFSGTSGENTLNITGGLLADTSGAASAIASGNGITHFNVSGGTTNLLKSGRTNEAGTSDFNITGGDVYNIRQDNIPPKDNLTSDHTITVTFGGGTDSSMQSYSLLNIDTLETVGGSAGNKTVIRVGGFVKSVNAGDKLVDTIANQNNTYVQGDYGNQITTSEMNIGGNSKLILHADQTHLGMSNADVMATLSDERSIADNVTVSGELTLDRSSLHSSNTTDRNVEVGVTNGGILYGFGENAYVPSADPGNTYTEFHEQYEQLRAQIYGNLNLATGATLQPYDLGLSNSYFEGGLKVASEGLFDDWNYDLFGNEHRGAVFRVDTETALADGGVTSFAQASGMRGRLFGDFDGLGGYDGREAEIHGEVRSNGDTLMNMQYSDSLLTVDADFSDVFGEVVTSVTNTAWERQDAKVNYDPVFGFHYDLKSKQEFDITPTASSLDQTYYYAVVNSENVIDELDGYGDANHLFDKLILKSDMLGKYDFLKGEDDKSVHLRYRMLAYHPTEGGIKRTMSEDKNRNEIVPGQYLDEIRYPFRGQPGSDLNGVLDTDPSANTPNIFDPADSYNNAGYNGEMWGDGDGFYAVTANPVFDNIREMWIKDWENLFQGMQLAVDANNGLYRAVRMLHAETYANVSQTAFDVMNMFTRNRERNAVSALFQVENEFYEDAMETAARSAGSGEAYASLDDYEPDDFYVENPIRFWGSAFGAYGTQRENYTTGSEMGYDNTTWGGSVGVVKEFGDYYLGGTFAYADTETKYDYSSVRAKHYIAEALAGARIFCLGFAEAFASYSYGDTKNRRVVDLASAQLGGYYGVATGEFASHVFSAGARVGYQKTFGDNWLLIPTVGVNLLHHRNGEFTESGRESMANRMVFDKGAMNRTLLRVPVEVRLNRAIALGGFMLMPELRAGVTPLLFDKRGEVTAKWVGNPINNRYFTSIGADRGSFEGWVGATVELSKKGRFYAAANYDYSYAKNHGSHNYSIQAGLNF